MRYQPGVVCIEPTADGCGIATPGGVWIGPAGYGAVRQQGKACLIVSKWGFGNCVVITIINNYLSRQLTDIHARGRVGITRIGNVFHMRVAQKRARTTGAKVVFPHIGWIVVLVKTNCTGAWIFRWLFSDEIWRDIGQCCNCLNRARIVGRGTVRGATDRYIRAPTYWRTLLPFGCLTSQDCAGRSINHIIVFSLVFFALAPEWPEHRN